MDTSPFCKLINIFVEYMDKQFFIKTKKEDNIFVALYISAHENVPLDFHL